MCKFQIAWWWRCNINVYGVRKTIHRQFICLFKLPTTGWEKEVYCWLAEIIFQYHSTLITLIEFANVLVRIYEKRIETLRQQIASIVTYFSGNVMKALLKQSLYCNFYNLYDNKATQDRLINANLDVEQLFTPMKKICSAIL